MHPILSHPRRLGLYLAFWLPLVPLVAALLAWHGGAGWTEALVLALPLAYLYAYMGLAAWYVCRAAPLQRTPVTPPGEVIRMQLLAAALSSALWVALGWAGAAALERLAPFRGAGRRFAGEAPWLFALGLPVYLLAAAVYYTVLAGERTRAMERQALQLTIRAREAELRALRAQLDPHFLFNSLNTLAALAGSDPAGARKMAILLAEFLRRSLRAGGEEAIPLGEELAHVASYLAVERARFGDRLAFEPAVEDEVRSWPVPPLLLQPLVENAVRHGIAQLLEGGAIRLEARRDGAGPGGLDGLGGLFLAVENPRDDDHSVPRGQGVGLANVRARLAARYGGAARLAVETPPGRFRVEIAIPGPAPEPASEKETGAADAG
jgi:two-component system, LytTR family, sensor histidine kinase AlgZ